MTDTHRRAAVAERAARAGGTVARQSFREELRVETKGDKRDLVTEADRDAQRQVLATIREAFPGDPVLAEEDAVPVGVDAGEGNLVDAVPERADGWIVDPIDGTTNFASGVALWGTSVAALVDGEPVGAATYLPAVGDAYTAGTESATRDGTTLTVAGASDPETFVVGLVGRFGRDSADTMGDVAASLARNLGDVRRFGSLQATLAFVADGALDAVVAPARQEPWDTVAGVHLIRSAGGVVTTVDGDPWRHDSATLVASGGGAHDAVRTALAAALDG